MGNSVICGVFDSLTWRKNCDIFFFYMVCGVFHSLTLKKSSSTAYTKSRVMIGEIKKQTPQTIHFNTY